MKLLFDHPPKIIWLRTGNLSTLEIAAKIEKFAPDIEFFITEAEQSCLEIC
jgi:predicted nuclease of predicted toxin-antitoxin system